MLGTDRELEVVGVGVLVDRLVVGVGGTELEVVGATVVDVTVLVAVVVDAAVVGSLWLLNGVSESRVPASDDGAALDDTGSRPGTVTGGRVGIEAVVVGTADADADGAGSAFWPTALPQAARSSTVMP